MKRLVRRDDESSAATKASTEATTNIFNTIHSDDV